MNCYHTEILEIKKKIYSNQGQLDTVIALRKCIDNNYHQNLNLDLLSQKQFVSKFHLLRVFKRYYGQTPQQYLRDVRIQRSKVHLAQGLGVRDTCFAVGFTSLGSFSSLFKKRTGLTPRDFQKRNFKEIEY